MKKEELDKLLEPMANLNGIIRYSYTCGKYLYDKAVKIQFTDKRESQIFHSSAHYIFQFLIIRFVAFNDAYQTINGHIPVEKAKEIKKLFKKIEVDKLRETRNIVLAHHFQKKNESALNDIYEGKYNYGTGDVKDFELLAQITEDIMSVIERT